jgi:hypothetical protein
MANVNTNILSLELTNGFLGFGANQSIKFSGHDSLELLNNNLKTKPIDWYYRDKDIIYSYNNLGHRSANINNINLDNYILFVGCSHTEGVGLTLEDRYSHIVAKELNCDYYNISVGGTGIDTMMYNLNMWLAVVKKRPKYIVWQWPESGRYLSYNNNIIGAHGMWQRDPTIMNFILAGDMSGYFNARLKLAEVFLEKLDNVIGIDIFESVERKSNLFFEKLDLARDDLHYGVLSNRNTANLVLDIIKQDKYVVSDKTQGQPI